MRVLHVIDSLGGGGGAEHALRVQLPLLREKGVSSVVVCLRDREGPLASWVRDEGTPVHVLQATSLIGKLIELRKIISRFMPDAVHATLIQATFMSRLATPRKVLLLNSLVNTTYDPVRTEIIGISNWKLWLLKVLDRVTSRRVDHFHVLTKAVENEAIEALKIDGSKVTIIPRGRSEEEWAFNSKTNRAATRRSLGVSDDEFLVVNVGRQEPQKAQVVLVEAFRQVVGVVDSAVLLIVGREGTATAQIANAVQRNSLEGKVRTLGYRTDIAEVLSAADVFVFPSFYEGLGSVLIEAMAVGTPIIASDIPPIREVLDGGECGRLTTVGDEILLARTIIELSENKGFAFDISTKARERFESVYSLDTVIEQTVNMYERLVNDT